MCDCYEAPCKVCGLPLPVHLADWNTKRDEIEVFCKGHIPKENVRIFTLIESGMYNTHHANYPAHKNGQHTGSKRVAHRCKPGWKMGIRALTDNARANIEGNHPNIGADWTIKDL